MGEEGKKISFGFSKLTKKTSIVSSKLNQSKPNSNENQVELIDCFEGNTIKLKDPIKVEDKILIIPLKKKDEELSFGQTAKVRLPSNDSTIEEKTLLSSDVSNSDASNNITNTFSSSQTLQPKPTLDELAAKEILEDLKNSKVSQEKRIFSVPLTNNPPEGEKESTLNDYENIPIEDFGMAMLRGMGWAPGKGIGKNEKLLAPSPSAPTLRPKGMGLGADKVIHTSENKSASEDLHMVKGGLVRIVAGPHKDSYGKIEGFDDEAGRLIVKLMLKNLVVSLNEFMIQLVSKEEFVKNSKVLNVAKYEEYKDNEKSMDGSDKTKQTSSSQNRPSIQVTTTERVSKTQKKEKSRDHSGSDSDMSENRSKQINSVSKISKKTQKERKSRSRSRENERKSRSRSRSREIYKKKSSRSQRRSRSYTSEEDSKQRRRSRSSSRDRKSWRANKNKHKKKKYCRSSDSSVSSESSREYSRNHKKIYEKKKKRRSRSRSRSSKKHRSRH